MLQIAGKIPQYWLFKKLSFPKLLPINLTISVTYRCNSRCKTCQVYNKSSDELSVDEYEKIFSSLGKSPYWITFSGGEPFLRKDIVEICHLAADICRPAIINIPTNGILNDLIVESVNQIAQYNKETKIIINISLDHIGLKHDEIRGVKGNFEKAIKTYHALRHLNHSNLTIGIHTVISKFNVKDFQTILQSFMDLKPDSFICEIAEKRKELDTIEADIAPDFEDYSHAVQLLNECIRVNRFSGISRLAQAFRMHYYDLTTKILKQNKQIIPCYAGFSSAQIAPDGEVWMCCIKAETIGNLRETNYNFKELWHSDKAKKARIAIKNGACYCPLANAAYTNMLLNVESLARVSRNYLALTFNTK